MKLIQLNTWGGRLTKNIAFLLEKEDPDVVCMQEVFSSSSTIVLPNTMFNSLQVLQELNGLNSVFFSPLLSVKYGKAKVDYGNAILSKHPIQQSRTIFTEGKYKSRFNSKNPKLGIYNLQIAKLSMGGKQLAVANHHGHWEQSPKGDEVSVGKMKAVYEQLRGINEPLIFTGDLNLSPNSPAIRALDGLNLRNLTLESKVESTLSTIHYAKKDVVCDYIFISKDIKVRSFKVADETVSDHKALIFEFDI